MRPNLEIAVEHVSLRRAGKAILDDVSVTFSHGRVCAILGPNGAGKSTLLRVVSGAIRPDSGGSVTLNGQPLASIAPAALARQRAVLSQEVTLAAEFDVADVVLLGRTPHVLAARETDADRRACEWALEAVGMTTFAKRRFPSLSGGEKQRVHLARVLAQLADGAADGATVGTVAQTSVGNGGFLRGSSSASTDAPTANTPASATPTAASCVPSPASATSAPPPRWLLLDEPTSALDLRHQHSVLDLARRLSRELGFGVVAVLHDLNLAMRYADSVVLLHEGRVAAAGATRATLTCERINAVYGVRSRIHCEHPEACPFIQTEFVPIQQCIA
jgi:iron complex transport system ATP-binding protein